MSKRKTLEHVLSEFNNVHNERYGYELVNEENYHKNTSVIPVVCKKHNIVFPIRVANHLRGQGCPLCANEKRRQSNTGNVRKRTKLVWGVGINDYEGNIKYNHVHIPSYHTWEQMLKRCYSKDYQKKCPTYKGCKVCDEWLRFSNFKKWFDDPINGYVNGYALDKDILFKGNKLYSPETCCFVPLEINSMMTTSKNKRGNTPIGTYYRKDYGKYEAYTSIRNKRLHIGFFDTVEEAFLAYKHKREAYIKEIAQEYYNKNKITNAVYNALVNFEIEIMD